MISTFLEGPMKTIVGGNHCKDTLARNPKGTELFKLFG
uniref:Uncharacterized protein n=1 Tax=Salix viminalis TaxID=40686 RepID=A0A6N2MAR0_SALVM